jgi:arabinose-5-phosphate isomerase
MDTRHFDIDYAKEVIEIEARGVQSLLALAGTQEFAAALDLIYSCSGAVIVTGIGKAGIVGRKISATMASVGTPSHFLHPVEAVHGDLGRVRPGDVVLGLSFGGETDEMIRLMNLVKQQGIKMIAVTGNDDSRLAQHCDVTLCIGKLAEACPLGVAPTVSTTAMLALGDALALTVMKAREFTAEDYARYHPGGSLGAKLITVGQSMDFKRDDELPVVPMTDTLRDMLKETQKLKRRGAVMAVDGAGKLAGILTDADFRRAVCDHGEAALEMTVADAMTPDCKYVTEETLAAEAMAIFHKYRIDDLPVVDSVRKPVGMIDVQDIVSIKVVG